MVTIGTVEAKNVDVLSFEDFQLNQTIEGTQYVIRKTIDLNGAHIVLPPNSKLLFKKGKLVNGCLDGNNTRIKYETGQNILGNCIIKGSWKLNNACSEMFDDKLETMTLLRNLSTISPHIKLSATREYYIEATGEQLRIETIEAYGDKRPIIHFHTINPNVNGLDVSGNNIVLRNLIIVDDYHKTNDQNYGKNDVLNGSTIGIIPVERVVESLLIEGCDFLGGTSSSYVASSKVKHCKVYSCAFSGYAADHAVYCSDSIETYIVMGCKVFDFECDRGMFKIRSSDKIKKYSICDVKAHNITGYLAILSLKETPGLSIIFDNISVTKDSDKTFLFPGFGITDETGALAGKSHFNAKEILIRHCNFSYGYHGAALIYHGAEARANVRKVRFNHTKTNESNFGGVFSDCLTVTNSHFNNCCNDKGIFIASKATLVKNTSISCFDKTYGSCLFLVNYAHSNSTEFTLKNVKINTESTDLFKVAQGDNMFFKIDGCEVTGVTRSLIYSNKTSEINYALKRSLINAAGPYKEKVFF